MNVSKLSTIMFIDIETVPQTRFFNELPDELQHLWEEKYEVLKRKIPDKYEPDCSAGYAYETSAGIYSEFGKIICISVGFIYFKKEEMFFRVKSFAGDNEKILLEEFKKLILTFFTTNDHTFCGHNIKEFDIPYLCRRMLINGVKLPVALQINTKKPWELNFIDTLDFWKFGDYKNYVSLKLLAAIFGVPTPKDDIDGSQVAGIYYNENDLARISKYCQKDVAATAQVWLKMNGLELIPQANIQMIELDESLG